MPRQPSDLVRVLEEALCDVLATPKFLSALADGVTASEHIQVTELGPLSEFTADHGVEVELRDTHSGRAQLFHLRIGAPGDSLVEVWPEPATV
ncbi:hypothetical protein AB0C84_43510 [Actinomadura sp. NPDC048955]|uniref:hypothetical protein n=1 Tax=Actinomadura sp. NPDC048955 TaxID=3158228 RepID=UPI0033F794A3